MKTYVIIVSRVFPSTHSKKCISTGFVEKILDALNYNVFNWCKKHTIRSNYTLWVNRIKEVQEGKAIISLRYWSGKPYNSKQVEFATLDKNSGCGIQMLTFFENDINCPYVSNDGIENHAIYDINNIAINDGLLLENFKEWFKKYDLSKPMAIIHFTDYRYL